MGNHILEQLLVNSVKFFDNLNIEDIDKYEEENTHYMLDLIAKNIDKIRKYIIIQNSILNDHCYS